MSKLSLEQEKISGADEPKEDPYKVSFREEKEKLGTPINEGRLQDFIREMQTNPLE